MGRTIDLYSYDYDKLVNKTLEVCETDNRDLVEKILLTCGNKIADRYIILHQELWEGCSCYFNLTSALDKVFNVDDTFSNIFYTYQKQDLDRQELINAIDICEIEDLLGIEISD